MVLGRLVSWVDPQRAVFKEVSPSNSPVPVKVSSRIQIKCNCRVGGHTRTKNYTRGGTTTESRDTEQNNFRVNADG